MGILGKIAQGANRFADEVLMPTTGLGRLGAYLSAASGNPLGAAAMAAMRDQREQQGTELERQLRRIQLAKALAPEQPSNDYERIVARLGQDAGDKYLSSLAAGPPMAIDTVDPTTGNTVRQFVPRTQLPGMVPQQPVTAPPGVTFKPIGGAGSSVAPRGFR